MTSILVKSYLWYKMMLVWIISKYYLRFIVNVALLSVVLVVQCCWKNDLGLCCSIWCPFPRITPFLIFQYKVTWHYSGEGCFVKFLIMPKRDSEIRSDPLSSLGRLMWYPSEEPFKIIETFSHWMFPDLIPDTKYNKFSSVNDTGVKWRICTNIWWFDVTVSKTIFITCSDLVEYHPRRLLGGNRKVLIG